ncbi:MAG: uracil phosphoribosyltransferase [Eggerthellaceae bacterium]|nr:uracil phosphoribosyltransferase [Eggerthellaceae bacterium]MBQ6455236.1 uracil phosphoribosyltransferase [Eggerthellaceae bacterium]
MYDDRVTLVDHPLVQHKLSILRDKDTSCKQFRELVREIALFEGYEAMRDLPLEPIDIETPIAPMTAYQIAGKKLVVVPILRAGLGLVDGILELMPAGRVGHLGMYRDEETHQPVAYFDKMPYDVSQRMVVVVDPMLATGGSAAAAIEYLRGRGVEGTIKLVVLVSAPEGIERVLASDPDVHIYTAAIDDGLNENAYIVPGLGDAGDRIFGTK